MEHLSTLLKLVLRRIVVTPIGASLSIIIVVCIIILVGGNCSNNRSCRLLIVLCVPIWFRLEIILKSSVLNKIVNNLRRSLVFL